MSATHSDRQMVYESLEPVMGAEALNTLMDLLPPHPDAELATRNDMHANTLMMRGEFSELRGELRGEMAELRGEIKEQFAKVDEKFAIMRIEFSDRFDQQRKCMLGQQRWMIGLLITILVAIIASAFGVVAAIGS